MYSMRVEWGCMKLGRNEGLKDSNYQIGVQPINATEIDNKQTIDLSGKMSEILVGQSECK